MEHNVYLYIAVVALVTYLIRVLPLTLIRREIKNPFLRSFLYYVPYVTLAAMTFPAILHATDSLWSGLAALVAAGLQRDVQRGSRRVGGTVFQCGTLSMKVAASGVISLTDDLIVLYDDSPHHGVWAGPSGPLFRQL